MKEFPQCHQAPVQVKSGKKREKVPIGDINISLQPQSRR